MMVMMIAILIFIIIHNLYHHHHLRRYRHHHRIHYRHHYSFCHLRLSINITIIIITFIAMVAAVCSLLIFTCIIFSCFSITVLLTSLDLSFPNHHHYHAGPLATIAE